MERDIIDCPRCDGFGHTYTSSIGEVKCKHCDSSGKILQTMTLRQQCKANLMRLNEGPVTRFVAIHRAIELAYAKCYSANVIALVLNDVLLQIDKDGIIKTNSEKEKG